MDYQERAWMEIDLNKLGENYKEINNFLCEKTKCLCIVKADAYGHGAIKIATFLESKGTTIFGVACLEEACELRNAGIKGDIIILGHTLPKQMKTLFEFDLIQTVGDIEYGIELAKYAKLSNHIQRIHLKIDTGMHRLGICCERDINEIVNLVSNFSLQCEGCFSHFSVADSFDESDIEFTKLQNSKFNSWLSKAQKAGINTGKVHISASAGLVNYPEFVYDYIRAGVVLYGFNSGEMNNPFPKSQVMSIKSRIAKIDELPHHETIGYGRTYCSEENLKVATIPIGYGDGLHRAYMGDVLITGVRCPIIGRISMDQINVDITKVENVKLFDIVTILGKDGSECITLEEMAIKTNTITNEIVTHFTKRLHKFYK